MWGAALVAAVFALGGTGCRREQAGAGAAPPAPVVTVSRPIEREVFDWDEYPGRLAAPAAVDVRARVSGFIEKAPFREGAIVKAGDLLFVIDERPYRAELNRLEAEVARQAAQVRFTTGEFERFEKLRQGGGGSETEFFNARQAMESAQASRQAAQAAVEAARLNVEWCKVTAPIAGRVSRELVTPGNLITGGTAQATLLTTITSEDPLYCYVDVDERSVRRYQQLIREKGRPSAREAPLPCQLALVDEPEFTHDGFIDFVDNRIDPSTGTIVVRGVFANPDGQLVPGFFARLRVPGRGPYRALLIPEVAIGSNLAQQYVTVVGPDDTAVVKPIKAGTQYGTLRAVVGVEPGDRVIVKGLTAARPGVKVRPQEVAIDWEASTRPVRPATRAATRAGVAATAPTTAPVPSTGPAAAGGDGR